MMEYTGMGVDQATPLPDRHERCAEQGSPAPAIFSPFALGPGQASSAAKRGDASGQVSKIVGH